MVTIANAQLKLDVLDRKILALLDVDARRATSEMARTLNHGRDTVDYRISRLQDLGVIQKFTIVIDPSKLGLSIYKTYLKLSGDAKSRKDVLRTLQNHPRVFWMAEGDGSWDLLFGLTASSLKEFHDLQGEILFKHFESIVEFEVFPIVASHWFHKSYLTSTTFRESAKLTDSYLTVGETLGNDNIDELDTKILKSLSANARTPITEIAKELDSTSDIVRRKIEKLYKAGVIVGARSQIDLSKLSMVMFKAQIFLRSLSKELEQNFFNYCINNENITYLITQIGRCRYEIEVEVSDYYEYNNVIEELRQHFSSYIRNVESSLIKTDVYKWVSSLE